MHKASLPTIAVQVVTGKGRAVAMAAVYQMEPAHVLKGLSDHRATHAYLAGSGADATSSAWMQIAVDMGNVDQRVHVRAIPHILVLFVRRVHQDTRNKRVPASWGVLLRIVAKDLAAARMMGPANVSPVSIVASYQCFFGRRLLPPVELIKVVTKTLAYAGDRL